jgi:cutinase
MLPTPMGLPSRGSATTQALLKLLNVVLLLAASLVSTVAIGRAADGEPCPNVEVIFARGTLEPPGVGATGQAFTDALNGRLGNSPAVIYPVDYPASLDFNQAGAGVSDAANKVLDTVNTCPATKMVIGGYSQGAAIAAYITTDSVPPGYDLPAGVTGPLPPNVARHVAAVALFGKPSSGFLNLVDHSAPPINIGPLYANKTIDLCAPEDPVCTTGGGFSRAAHSAYKSNGMADQAADFAAKALGR